MLRVVLSSLHWTGHNLYASWASVDEPGASGRRGSLSDGDAMTDLFPHCFVMDAQDCEEGQVLHQV